MDNDEVAIVGGAGFVGFRLTTRFTKKNTCSNKYCIDLSGPSGKVIYLDVEDAD